MAKRVLNVGQCAADNYAMRRLLEARFAAQVVEADSLPDALAHLGQAPFDLVLVNRLLDADGSEGLDVVKAIKADATLAQLPVMLVSNFPASQQAAVEAGALAGFGKAALSRPETEATLRSILG